MSELRYSLTKPVGISTLPEFSILSLAVRRKGIARSAVLHLDRACSAGRGRYRFTLETTALSLIINCACGSRRDRI
jgi:hypothetical protein